MGGRVSISIVWACRLYREGGKIRWWSPWPTSWPLGASEPVYQQDAGTPWPGTGKCCFEHEYQSLSPAESLPGGHTLGEREGR